MIANAFHNALGFLLVLAIISVVGAACVLVLAFLADFLHWIFC